MRYFRPSLARSRAFRVGFKRDSRYYLYVATKDETKVYNGIGLYRQDWQRIDRNRLERESWIRFIEEALQLMFDVREGRAKVSRLSSLT